MDCNLGILPQPAHAVLVPANPIGKVHSSPVTLLCQGSSHVSPDPEEELELVTRALTGPPSGGIRARVIDSRAHAG